MKNSFYKIIKFEIKLNYRIWALILLASFAILLFFFFKFHALNNSKLLAGSFIPVFIITSCIFTLYSYTESTSKQTMGIYHSLPVSGNIKFLSKQLITFVVFPIILLLLYLLFTRSVDFLIFDRSDRNLLSTNFKPINTFLFFLTAHSIATFFAIIFKKHKLLLTIITYFCLQFIAGLFFVIIQSVYHSSQISGEKLSSYFDFIKNLPGFTYILIPAVFYFFSYRLFFKRQL